MHTRRNFFKKAVLATAAVTAGPALLVNGKSTNGNSRKVGGNPLFFDISLAQWSLHNTLNAGKLDNLDFPAYTKEHFDIHAVEYVNRFFASADKAYAKRLLARTEDIGVKNLLIMIDGEGNLGDQDDANRRQSVENHFKWVECAEVLGCHSIRVNAGGAGSENEVAYAAAKGLTALSRFAADYGINVIVENHGGYSSRATWLASVIREVGMVNCGTLPDFGNFKVSDTERYDIYLGIKELMPFAKGVSAKSNDFDEAGNETEMDYYRILKIVKEAGYRGFIGIEYEGSRLSEDEGIMATKNLLLKAGATL